MPQPKIVPITESTWLAEIERLSARQADGFTTSELAASASRSLAWARQMIRKGIDAGKLEFAGQRTSMRIDGRPGLTAVYRLVR